MAGEPVRVQLRRTKGWRLQEASQAINGLPAVKVTRGPGNHWGNPYEVGGDPSYYGGPGHENATAEQCVILYRDHVEAWLAVEGQIEARGGHSSDLESFRALRGKNLACWCALSAPCHAHVLLELANRPVCTEIPHAE